MSTPSDDPVRPALHALIVEDDLLTGLDLQAMLQPLGYESFAFASTAQQALEQALLKTPDLATFDLGLLDGDGREVARAVEGVCAHVTTLFITGDPDGVGAEGRGRRILSKPVTALDLRRAIGQAAIDAGPLS